MRAVNSFVLLLLNLYCDALDQPDCGLDRSPVAVVYEGFAAIETYPWMGILYFPTNNLRFTTTVVLITRQMVIATANEIDKLPKSHVRSHARVVLGDKCDKNEIRVRDYTFHPEYDKYSISALAMIQLEIEHLKLELRSICQPPPHFREPQFFALTLAGSCKKPKVKIHRMEYVNNENCSDFYRRNDLSQDSIWPVHTACARAVSGGRCVWRSGSVLAVKQDGRWRMLGFSVYGPGCGAPARFLHYGVYLNWVRRTTTGVGMPAITRIADDHIVMRRTLSNVQRYGPCDPEETFMELYSDKVSIMYKPGVFHAKYNLTLYADVEYSCIVFKVRSLTWQEYNTFNVTPEPPKFVVGKARPAKNPIIHLRRWCATSKGMCGGFQHLEIQFYVDVVFSQSAELSIHAYGREARVISAALGQRYANHYAKPLHIPSHSTVMRHIFDTTFLDSYKWYFQNG